MSDLTREEREALALVLNHYATASTPDSRAADLPRAINAVERIVTAREQAAYERGAAEVRARVEAVVRDPRNDWWHTGGTQCCPIRALRDALDGPRKPVEPSQSHERRQDDRPGATDSGEDARGTE